MARMTRYSLYYRLIDVAFLCQMILLAGVIYKQLTGQSAFNGGLYYPFIAIFTVALLVPALLIFQRWLRDDFSEMLWQRTAGTVLKALIILPIPVMIAIAVALASGDWTPPAPESAMVESALLEGVIVGFIRSMLTLWLITPVIFTCAFQWHRWRASR